MIIKIENKLYNTHELNYIMGEILDREDNKKSIISNLTPKTYVKKKKTIKTRFTKELINEIIIYKKTHTMQDTALHFNASRLSLYRVLNGYFD